MPQALVRFLLHSAPVAHCFATSATVAQCTPGRFVLERDKFNFVVSHSAGTVGRPASR